MQTACPPEGEATAYRTTRSAFDAAVAARDALRLPVRHPEYQAAQALVARTYDAMQEVDTSHFYLNVWAMTECRDLMNHFGMLSAAPPPSLPSIAADCAATESAQPYDVNLAEQSPVELPTGISVYKLSAAGGLLVTPAEIRTALAAYESTRAANPALLSEIVDEAHWWPEWIDYLRRAAEQGGFRAHGPSTA